MSHADTSVLIVGAGPVGLMMAAQLRRFGVRCRIVDQAAAPTDRSKAIGVHARTLELFDALGIADDAIARGRPMHGTNVYADGKRLAHVSFDDIDSPFPFVLSLAQDETERLLAEHVEGAGVTVERSKKLVSLLQDDDGVTATLATGADSSGTETVRAAYVVGCDGAHSAVRHALGFPFEGAAYEETFALADLAIDTTWPDDEIHAFLSEEGGLACFPMRGDHRWRLIVECAPDSEPTLAWFQELVGRRAGPEARLRDPRWLATFRVHRRIVPSYRSLRAFLAGDAAHVHSPVGGQGMNMGLHDATNLAWKLALVTSGEGRPALLDAYDLERRPVAAATVANTDVAQRAVTLRNPIARELRNRALHFLSGIGAVQKQMLRTASAIGIHYRKSPIVREDRLAVVQTSLLANRNAELPSLDDWLDFGAAPRAGDRAPDAIVDLEGRRLFDVLRSPRHALLLFDGAAATVEGYVRLDNIGRRVRERYGKLVDVHIVVPHPTKPLDLAWDGSLFLDAAGSFHHRYGAGSECLYLVRPDGYVAYRSQPADEARVMQYLATVFT